jgi:hypothetical protein
MPAQRQKNSTKKRAVRKRQPDDFKSVARRIGADEDKERFEARLGKIAKVKPR